MRTGRIRRQRMVEQARDITTRLWPLTRRPHPDSFEGDDPSGALGRGIIEGNSPAG